MTELTCEDSLNLLLERADTPLHHEKESQLNKHLKWCDKCRGESKKLDRLEDMLKRTRAPAVPRGNIEDAIDSVLREMRSRRKGPMFLPRSITGWAAAAAAFFILAGGILVALGELGIFQNTETVDMVTTDPVRRGSDEPDTSQKSLRIPEENLVEELVQGDLALSETENPAEKALIFCDMSQGVLRALEGATESDDTDSVTTLGKGYTSLINEGVLPHLDSPREETDRDKLHEVIGKLKYGRDNLISLIDRVKGEQRKTLAEALIATRKCMEKAEEISAH